MKVADPAAYQGIDRSTHKPFFNNDWTYQSFLIDRDNADEIVKNMIPNVPPPGTLDNARAFLDVTYGGKLKVVKYDVY